MIIRTTAMASLMAVLLMSPGAAAAQQSTSADGEFRWVFETTLWEPGAPDDIVFMVQSRPPTVAPSGPVEVWVWTFYRSAENLSGMGDRDSEAVLARVDCEAGTREGLQHEGFLGDALVWSYGRSGWAAPSHPDTASSEIVRVACEPGYGDGLLVFPDLGTARAAAQAHFAGDYP